MQWWRRARQWWQVKTGSADTPLDGDTPAWLCSLLVHLAILLGLTLWAWPQQQDDQGLLLATPPLSTPDELPAEDFAHSLEATPDVGALSDAGLASAMPQALEQLDVLSQIRTDFQPVVATGSQLAAVLTDPMTVGPEPADQVVVKGVGSVGTTGAAGAVDRLTLEILHSLEQRPTLVLWMFDQSGSLRRQREEIHDRMERVFRELEVIREDGHQAFVASGNDRPLLSAVVQFGRTQTLLTKKPTDDLKVIQQAILAVTPDESGVENVFTAIGRAVEEFRRFCTNPSLRRNVMVVVFTDEAGDDVNRLDATVDLCRKLGVRVYVVGVPAPFGRRDAYVKYVDPDPQFDQTPQPLPVHQGPESLMPERIKLHFPGASQGDETIDSGFGSYALTRLAYETGGLYFAVHPNRNDRGRVRPGQVAELSSYMTAFFDPAVMRKYRPDYLPVAEYQRLLAENKARAGLVEAARLSWTAPPQGLRRQFPKRDEASLAALLTRAQRDVAKIEPQVRRIYDALAAGERDREKLRKPRWRAGYDLAMGRALAVKVRTEGYNMMLAKAKRGMSFADEKNDTWVLRRSGQVEGSSVLEKQAEQATTYLRRVIEEHPGTPWAMLARKELELPLGWKWAESYTGVNAPPQNNNANNNNPQPRDDRRRELAPRKPRRPAPRL